MRLVWVVSLVCLSMYAGRVVAQQQTNVPPSDQNSPLIQPAGVVQSACPQPLAHRAPGSTVSSADWVELQRTGCLGACPAYTVRLYASGAVTWHGDGFVEVAGAATAEMDAAAASNLIQQLRDHGFELLCGSYTRSVTDNATYITTDSIGGTVFRVSDYAASAPAWLRDFDDRIDAVADTHRWRHGEPSRELLRDRHLEWDVRLPKPGQTRLMRAAGTPNGAVQLLLAQKVPVDAEDASGWTALMYAAGTNASVDQVQLLLAAGANAAHRSRAGETLLFAAAGSDTNPVRKLVLLQRAGANVAAAANDGTTVLMIAASRYWQPGVLKAVLDMGADPAVRNGRGKTALDVLEQARGVRDVPEAYAAARAMLLAAR